MKRVYWRPRGVSSNALILIASIAVVSMVIVEVFPERTSETYLQQMLEASKRASEAFAAIKRERGRRRIAIDPIADPSESGLIGVAMSDVTSAHGNLLAKQTSVNPNWAAVGVHLLREAGVKEGDTVAVGLSGSFPALNAAVFAAMATMHLEAVVITSVSGSQWGANHPKFLWLDMERHLYERKIFPYRSAAVSLGGAEDRAIGMSEKGIAALKKTIGRTGLRMIDPANYAESVVERLAIYRSEAGDKPIRAYVNIGGGTSSVGTRRSKFAFEPGINTRTPPKAALIDSVMARFLDERIPVIHFLQINHMAQRYGLPLYPQTLPEVGSGQVFLQRRYNPWLAGSGLLTLVASLFLFVRSGRGRMVFQGRREEEAQLEPTL